MIARPPLRSSGFALVARVLRATGRIVGVLVLARFFTSSDVADFALAFSIASIVGLASDLGLTDHAVRVIAGSTANTAGFERQVVVVRLATLLLGLPAAWFVARCLGVHDVAALGTSAYVLAGSATETFAAIRRGHRRHDLEAVEVTPLIVAVAGASATAAAGASAETFFVVLGGLALGAAVVRGFVLVAGTRGGSLGLRVLVAESRWMLVRSLATLALSELPVILLDRLASDREVALFAVAARPIGITLQLLAVLPMVYTPLLSRAATVSNERLRARTLELNLLHIVATPAAFAACVFGGDLLLFISGESYRQGRDVLVVLSLGTLLYASTLSTVPLIVLRRERIVVLASTLGSCALVVASLLLVPEDGALGVAIATCIAYGAVKVLLIVGYRLSRVPLGDRVQLGVLVIVAGALAASVWAPAPIGTATLAIAASLSAFGSIYLLRRAPAD